MSKLLSARGDRVHGVIRNTDALNTIGKTFSVIAGDRPIAEVVARL